MNLSKNHLKKIQLTPLTDSNNSLVIPISRWYKQISNTEFKKDKRGKIFRSNERKFSSRF